MLALFCLAWLQTAALPCAMAHSGPMPTGAQAEHCPYCPPADSPATTCHDGADCAYPHEPQVDARVAASLFVAIAPVQFLPPALASASMRSVVENAAPEPVPRVPLSVSYCRFIE